MIQARPSILITSGGVSNLLLGAALIGIGIYLLSAGSEGGVSLFQLQQAAVRGSEAAVPAENTEQGTTIRTVFTRGMSGLILTTVSVVGTCAILQGWPLLLIGLGVVRRSKLARLGALLFAALAMPEGIACMASGMQSSRLFLFGLVLCGYTVYSFVVLLSKRSSEFFSGWRAGTYKLPGGEDAAGDAAGLVPVGPVQQPRPAVIIVMAGLLFLSTATAATFATLFFA